jgi:hypothetical protein
MKALLEVAESEFLNRRKVQSDYQRSVDVRVLSNAPDLPADVVTMRPFIEQNLLVAKVDHAIVRTMGIALLPDLPEVVVRSRAEAARFSGMVTLQDVNTSSAKFGDARPEFASRCKKELWPPYPPDTPVLSAASIRSLGMLLTSCQGVDSATRFTARMYMKDLQWNIADQVAIARQIAARY